MFVLIANRLSPTNVRLLRALRRMDAGTRFVRPAQLASVSPPARALARLDVSRALDGLEDGFDALARFERAAPVLNGTAALVACHDKLATARLLEVAGLPHPRGVLIAPGAHRLARPLPLQPPFVVKPRFGSWGAEIALCEDDRALARQLRRIRRTSWFQRHGALVQELVPPAGFDLRLIVCAGKVLGAVRRVAGDGEWRTNVSLGAGRRATVPSPDARALAIAAAAAVGADLVGVDLLPHPDGGYMILELNGAADFTDTYSLDGFDVFNAIARRLLGDVDSWPVAAAVAGV